MSVRLLTGDCRDILKTLPDASVQCCVTSPPYYGLRDYGVDGQIGLEASPDDYVATLVEVFREVRRVLRDDGVLWLNLGDSYNNRTKVRTTSHQPALNNFVDDNWSERAARGGVRMSINDGAIKEKDLLGMPWRVAFALQADGWYLRSALPWVKRSTMPESVTDRPTSAIEYVFLFAKNANYFWDAQAVARRGAIQAGVRAAKGSNVRSQLKDVNGRPPEYWEYTGARNFRNSDLFFDSLEPPHGLICDGDGNPLALDVNPAPFKESHFATFPPKLIDPLIKAATSERGCCAKCGAPWVRVVERSIVWDRRTGTNSNADRNDGGMSCNAERTIVTTGWSPSCSCDPASAPCIVLDPFFGAGTTGLVCDRLGRDCIGIDLNSQYADMAHERIRNDAPLFAEVIAE